MIVIACPGQGSQTPGFLTPWLEDAAVQEWLRTISAEIGVDLIQHGTVSDADTIRATQIAQPLIVAAGILTINAFRTAVKSGLAKTESLTPAANEAKAQQLLKNLVFAGHSVGEITAAYGAGVFDASTAMQFVSARANAMQECAAANATSMAAVLGGEADSVAAKLQEFNLTAANYNGGGQLVVGGSAADITRLVADAPEKARVIQLQVAGAFHTGAMEPARTYLRTMQGKFAVRDPQNTLYTNYDGNIVTSGATYLELLIEQVANPVRWDLCMENIAANGATTLIEVSPSGALTGLARRGIPGVKTKKINTPADVTAVVTELLAEAA